MMNTTQILDNLSQESLFAIGIFGFALLFYMTRLVNSLKNRIYQEEEAELSGRKFGTGRSNYEWLGRRLAI